MSFRRARQGDDLRNSNGGDKRMRNFRQWIRELLEEFIASEENGINFGGHLAVICAPILFQNLNLSR